MQTATISNSHKLPNRLTKLALGLLILTLTMLLIFTAVAPFFNSLSIDEACETAAESTFETFTAETAVPNCWLVP